MNYNNFIDIDKIDILDLQKMLDEAIALKQANKEGRSHKLLDGKQLAMIFEKSSTRTRVSFEVGINQLGGNAIILDTQSSQMGKGEIISDTAQVLSRYVDIIMARTFSHDSVIQLAECGSVPVINGLTDYSHPCQVMTDILTFTEHCGDIKGKIIVWIGDYNNMTTSWIHAAEKFQFYLHISCPEEFIPSDFVASKYVKIFGKPSDAVQNADCITTDTWVSMGDKNEEEKKHVLAPYQVNDELMKLAEMSKKGGANIVLGNSPLPIFMHCLPAYRGQEVTESVIDGAHSVVFDEAENRLHMQKAIMLWCFGLID